MKIQLEFEDSDLEKMITAYFEKAGFRVKNLEELCEQFKEAFPNGLKVDAEIIPVEMKPVPAAVTPYPEPRALTDEEHAAFTADMPARNEEEEPEPEVAIERQLASPKLTFTDLMDPTMPPPPRVDPEEDKAEIIKMARRSQQLAKDGPKFKRG